MTGFGIKQLDDKILEMVGAPGMAAGGVGWAVNARQAEALTRAAEVRIAPERQAAAPQSTVATLPAGSLP